MKPVGRVPAVASDLGDLVFDLDCSAEAQVDNTGDMLVVFAQIWRDRRLDESDAPYVRALLAHTKVEHKLNLEQSTGTKQVRRLLNPCFDLITNLRAQLQLIRQQTVRG